ncbi:MAG: dinucleotide-utilizing protein [Parcubacteria group bacterium Gr01-1014_20]|nr:MAG: dinucleotide-utilizing protein [Parcubacteria group bacterium Gr01-1014_20]
MEIKDFISERSKNISDSKPLFLNLSDKKDVVALSGLIDQGVISQVVDDYKEQQLELFQIANPSLVYQPSFKSQFDQYSLSLGNPSLLWQHGRWVYFPWLSTLVHILEEDDFQKVRTARNRNLITEEEQSKFYNSTIGVAGLSVGNSVALAIVLQGGGKRVKLADHDRLALSNTNRIRVGVENLGLLKAEMTAREIYAVNPYAQVEIFKDGLTKENIEKFFDGLDIIIDEIDNLAVKYLIREQAQKRKLAVVMAADNGDNGVVDIERYDLDPNQEFFHGRMGKVSYEELNNLDKFGIGKMITKLVGPENVTQGMKDSLLEIGKTTVSWPQLGGAALLNGSAVAYCVRKILNGQPLENNRALISLDEKLIPSYNSPEEIKNRKQSTENFKKIFGL